MNRILESLGWMGRYLWAGWAGLSGIFCFLAAWQAGHEIYGSFILPSPGETFAAMGFWRRGRISSQSCRRAQSGP